MTKNIVIGVLVATTLLFAGLYFHADTFFGSSTGPQHYQRETFLQGLQIGSRGTEQSNQVVSTCSIISNASAAATSTVYGYCTGLTGITSSDTVDANFATSSTIMTDQWVITGAKASTTAGSVDFRILNLTGTARAFSAASTVGSSTVISAGH